MKRILITGAAGQIGTELTRELRRKYGAENVVATDLKLDPVPALSEAGPYECVDVMNIEAIHAVLHKYEIDSVFHMAAILSAVGEQNPQRCWDVNMNGSINVLNLAVEHKLRRVVIPSSIAVWGPDTPALAPQDSALHPTTMYGVTKVANEVLADYYVRKFGVDSRGLRYPGIISSETLPGGGTTDYAVEIFYEAVKHGHYTCFLREDSLLPMMYMPDCLKATIDLAEADVASLRHHNDFNVGALSFTAGELAEAIRKYIPGFTIEYKPDFRQDIADSWPDAVDDTAAREEWGWQPEYDLDAMTKDMIEKLTARLK
jgi:nucleoside-diphosphate-sugar epimerase